MRQNTPLSFYVAPQSTGIVEVSFNPTRDGNDSLSITSYTTNAGHRHGWPESYGNFIYSISRTQFPDEDSESAGIFVFSQDRTSSNNLTRLDSETSNGEGGVYCDVSPDGRILVCANIDEPRVSVYPRLPDGTINPATYIFHYNLTTPGPGTNESQIQANPYEAKFDLTGQCFFVPDRGSDRIYACLVNGPDNVVRTYNISLPSGTSPRHLEFVQYNTTRTYMLVIGELDNTIRVSTLDYALATNPREDGGLFNFLNLTLLQLGAGAEQDLTITHTQSLSILSADLPPSPPNNDDLAAEIYVTNDGRFAYASNRNTLSLDSDTIAIFAIDESPQAHELRYIGFNETLGKIPRHFALSNDEENRWVAVANQLTQDVVVVERDVEKGWLREVKGRLVLGRRICRWRRDLFVCFGGDVGK